MKDTKELEEFIKGRISGKFEIAEINDDEVIIRPIKEYVHLLRNDSAALTFDYADSDKKFQEMLDGRKVILKHTTKLNSVQAYKTPQRFGD